jgi:molybdate transport system substrate-binding protein
MIARPAIGGRPAPMRPASLWLYPRRSRLLSYGCDGGALGACRASLERWFPKAVVSSSFRVVAYATGAKSLWRTAVLRFGRILAAFAATVAIAAMPHSATAQEKSITVFAAASMKNALDDVDAAFTKQSGIKVLASYAASSALMKQIEQGAPADVYVSADLQWMDYGSQKKLVKDDTRFNLLGNRLVLIAPTDSKIGKVTIGPGFDLAKLAGDGRIATGDVRAVPAGLYAKAALEKLGVWASVEPKMAMAENVRAALVLVARGEAPLGIVYETDAKVEPGVKIVSVFPEDSHPPIVYPVALTTGAKPDAAQYLAFLRTQAAKSVFEGYGFTFLIKPTS